jgi:hypothetical protein
LSVASIGATEFGKNVVKSCYGLIRVGESALFRLGFDHLRHLILNPSLSNYLEFSLFPTIFVLYLGQVYGHLQSVYSGILANEGQPFGYAQGARAEHSRSPYLTNLQAAISEFLEG